MKWWNYLKVVKFTYLKIKVISRLVQILFFVFGNPNMDIFQTCIRNTIPKYRNHDVSGNSIIIPILRLLHLQINWCCTVKWIFYCCNSYDLRLIYNVTTKCFSDFGTLLVEKAVSWQILWSTQPGWGTCAKILTFEDCSHWYHLFHKLNNQWQIKQNAPINLRSSNVSTIFTF